MRFQLRPSSQRAYPDAAYGNWVMAEWQRKIPRAFAPGSARKPIETVVACKNGAKKNVVWGFVKLGERNLAYGLDITEQKQATQALRESEARFRRFFEENGSVMLMLSPEDGEIVAANQAAASFTGIQKSSLWGCTLTRSTTRPQSNWPATGSRRLTAHAASLLIKTGAPTARSAMWRYIRLPLK